MGTSPDPTLFIVLFSIITLTNGPASLDFWFYRRAGQFSG